jgi:hypothetical protein
LNYFEGQVSIDGRSIGQQAIGTTELIHGQSLQTQAGKAELLLTPGVFLRVGDNSSVTMISPSLTNTELRLDKGKATIEAAELRLQTDIIVDVGDARVRLAQAGLYEINADQNIVRVYQGQLFVDANNREIAVKSQFQLAFDAYNSMTPKKFNQAPDEALDQAKAPDVDQSQAGALDQDQLQTPDPAADPVPNQDDLYQWSSLRSSYLAEANVDQAEDYQSADDMGNSSDGWAWDPYYATYTFIPGGGTTYYSPFGWGFYSPYDVGYAPYGFYGHYYHHFDHDYHRWDYGNRNEAHYYDHFDHGAYRGPGSSYYGGRGAFIGRYPSGAVGGGYRAQGGEGLYGGRGGEGFRGGRGGEGFHGGYGGEVMHGGQGQVGHGGEGFHGPGSFGGSRGGTQGGAGVHSGAGSVGGSHGMGGGAHGGGGGAHH